MNSYIKDIVESIMNNPKYQSVIILIFAILVTIVVSSKKKSTKVGVCAFLALVILLVVNACVPAGYRLMAFVLAVMFVAIGILYTAFSIYARDLRRVGNNPTKKLEEELKIFLEEQKDDPNPKYCPMCGARMVITKQLVNSFYSCTNYPNCKYYEKIDNSNNLDEEKMI